MGKVREISVYEYMNRLKTVPKEDNMVHYLMIISILAAISVIFFVPPLGLLLTIFAALNNIVRVLVLINPVRHILIDAK